MGFFDDLEELEVSDLYSCFTCSSCNIEIPCDATVQNYLSIELAGKDYPSWRFYENACFCSMNCENSFLNTQINLKLEPLIDPFDFEQGPA